MILLKGMNNTGTPRVRKPIIAPGCTPVSRHNLMCSQEADRGVDRAPPQHTDYPIILDELEHSGRHGTKNTQITGSDQSHTRIMAEASKKSRAKALKKRTKSHGAMLRNENITHIVFEGTRHQKDKLWVEEEASERHRHEPPRILRVTTPKSADITRDA